jgi:VanZ family protein
MLKTPLFKRFFILILIVGFLDFIGNKFHLHWEVWWFDVILHFLAGIMVSMFAVLFIVYVFNLDKNNRRKIIIKSILFALLIGILWEFFELYFGATLLSDGKIYYIDTSSDILMDLLGAFLGSIYSYKLVSKNGQ